jgi:signal transduction histidine kinase
MLPTSMALASPALARLTIATAAGLLLMGLGAATLAGWILGVPLLAQIRPQFQPIFYTTAFTFVLSGGVLLLLAGGSRRLALVLTWSVAVSAVLAFILPPVGVPPTVHAWLTEHLFLLAPEGDGRMAELTATCFLAFALGACVLTLAPRQVRWRTGLARLIGVGVGTVGAIGAIGYLTGLGVATHSTPVTNVSAPATIGFMLIGIGLVAVSTSEAPSRSGAGGPQWLPAIAGVVSLIVALGLWQAVRHNQLVERAMEASQAAANIDGQIDAQYHIDQQQLAYIAEQLSVTPSAWPNASRPYLTGQPSHRAVVWIDRDLIIRRVAGLAPAPLQNLDLGINRVRGGRLRQAAVTHAQVTVRADDLQEGRLALLIAEPVLKNEDVIGFVASIVDLETTLRLKLRNDEALGFCFVARDGERVVYQSAEEGVGGLAPQHSRPLTLGPVSMQLDVWPTHARASQNVNQLPLLVLAFGIAVSFLLSATIAGAQTARRRWAALERVNHRLAAEIARRQRAQRELQQMAAELRRSNRELEDFASIASHDLRAPLQKVKSFADLLDEEYQPYLDAEGRDVLHRLRRSTLRMQRLVDDLLQLARVRASGRPFTRVDLAGVAREVVSDLEPVLQSIGGRVDIGELPIIDADPTQMQQLLQNLIANALKFQRQDVKPRVGIQCCVIAPEEPLPLNGRCAMCELRVSDNGIGFDNKYAERIFRPFERLHGQHEYEGSGIGLAVCAKIVERHGGTIVAHGVPGEGATFLVTLPVRHASTLPDQRMAETAEVAAG